MEILFSLKKSDRKVVPGLVLISHGKEKIKIHGQRKKFAGKKYQRPEEIRHIQTKEQIYRLKKGIQKAEE